MKETLVNTCWFTPFEYLKGQTALRNNNKKICNMYVLGLSLMTLSGCVTSTSNTAPLAPMPPQNAYQLSQTDESFLAPPHSFTQDEAELQALALAQQIEGAAQPGQEVVPPLPVGIEQANKGDVYVPKSALSAAAVDCSIKDRFDRKALIAYEWNRNRVALDVDGVGLGGGGDDMGFRVEYKIRLQPEKTKVQKCRYSSNWQGIVGSGYNELILRDDDTVMEEVRTIKDEAIRKVKNIF